MFRFHILFLSLLLTTFFFVKCVPPVEEVPTVYVDFTDPEIQRLYDQQDRGLTDSLVNYFNHKNPTYRYLSAMAFASVKDTSAVDSLANLLYDPVDLVRIAAAYSLGQIGDLRAEEKLLNAFDRQDTSGVSKYFNAAILEATGKCGREELVEKLAGISTYRPTDTVLLEGQAYGLYRFALRDMVVEKGTDRMVEVATDRKFPSNARFVAANYLMRAKNIDLSDADETIAAALPREDDPRIRMALVIALGKTKTERAANTLLYQYNIERDDRVKINLLRALANFEYEKIKPALFQALESSNTSIALTAAEVIITNGIAEEATNYWQLSKTPNRPWQVKTALYAAALTHMPFSFEESRRYINWELRRLFENSENPYEKAAALKALSHYGWNYRYIRDAAYPSDLAPVRTASVEALAKIARIPDFKAFFGGGYRAKQELAECFRDAILSGDIGMMAVAAEVLRDPNLNFKENLDSLNFLDNALKKLRIPQELETYNELKRTIDYFNGTKNSPDRMPQYSHKIPWKLVTDLKDKSRAVIKTDKGDITIKFMTEYAPGTVANFIELINEKYYNGKNFHRVVPNFVIQGGCSRGDGYSSLSYTIRSELPYLHYKEGGYVGMASAGNHTESSQFFITHSPALHLDGNYTIFAKVEKGMDVVNKIQVGDVINEVVLTELK